MTPAIAAEALSVEGRLRPIDLTIEAGSMAALVGPNGSGKTSLLRALAGIELSGGDVIIHGEPLTSVPPARRPRLLSFLPASRDIAWPIPVRDLIRLGTALDGQDDGECLLDLLELRPLADRPVSQLSTGERSRVLLARSLASRPKVLLLDEPLSNLDPYWVLRTLDIVSETVSGGSAALVSLHDLDRIGAFDRVLVMDGGAIVADGDPERLRDSAELGRTFGVERSKGEWRIRPQGDRRSSP